MGDSRWQRCLAELDDLDRQIESGVGRAATLDRSRTRATKLRVLVEGLVGEQRESNMACGFAELVASIARDQLHHFPDNIFSDFDFLCGSLWDDHADEVDALQRFDEYRAILSEILAIYGQNSTIRFRYMHDFIYGFDWARWVARQPDQRLEVGPFDLVFLRYSRSRGQELLALIAEDDEEYPPLPGDQPRNPFRFFREPPDERTLLLDLASRDLIPVPAWQLDATPQWDRSYQGLREERAKALGLIKPRSANSPS